MTKKGLLPLLALSTSILVSCGKKTAEVNADSSKKQSLETKASGVIIGDLEWREITTLDGSHPIRKNSFPVGDITLPRVPGVRFSESRCTGALITEDILLTNHHCIPTAGHSRGVTVSFRHEKGVPKHMWETYNCSTFVGNNKELDYALLRCDKSPGRRFGVVTLSDSFIEKDEAVYVIHQNCDYFRVRGCDHSKKYSHGKITDLDTDYHHDADTLGGSSGSPVFSLKTHKVIGLHHAGKGKRGGGGRGISNMAVPMSKIINHIRRNYRKVVFSHYTAPMSFGQDNRGEPNDSVYTSQVVSQLPFSTKGLTVKRGGDKDFFTYQTDLKGKVLFAKLHYIEQRGDLKLTAFNENGDVVGKFEDLSNMDKIRIPLDGRSQKLYFQVDGGSGQSHGQYQLDLKAMDEGKDLETAFQVTFPYRKGPRVLKNSEDADLYEINLKEYKRVYAFLRASKSSYFNLIIIDSNGKPVTRGRADGAGGIQIAGNLRPGKYYLGVVPQRGARNVSYSLTIQ